MSHPPPIAQTSGQTLPYFSDQNLRELASARTASRKLRRAVRVANFDGWTIALFGALSLGLGFGDLTSVGLGLALGVFAFVELRGASQLKRLNVAATRTLSLNQLALGGLIVLYGAWRLYVTTRPGYAATMAPELSDPQIASVLGVGSMDDFVRPMMKILYGGVIALAIVGPGYLAWYYHTRAKLLRAYLAQTPAWIITLQQQGVAL